MQKNWIKPELIILQRATSDDTTNMNVAVGCKTQTLGKNQPDAARGSVCYSTSGRCASCNTIVTS